MRTATRHSSPSDPGSATERLAGALCLALYSPEGTDLLAAYALIKHAAANYLRDCARGVCVPQSNAFQSALDALFAPGVKKIRLYLCTRCPGIVDSALTLHRFVDGGSDSLWCIAYPRLDSFHGRELRTGVKVDWPLTDTYPTDVIAGLAPRFSRTLLGPKALKATAEQIASTPAHHVENAIKIGYLAGAIHGNTIGIHPTSGVGKIVMEFNLGEGGHLASIRPLYLNPSSKPGPKKRCIFFTGVEDRPLISWSIKGATFYEDEPDARIDLTTALRELLPSGLVPYVAAGMRTGPLDLFVNHYSTEIGIDDIARINRRVRPGPLFPTLRRLGREDTGRVLFSPNFDLLLTLRHHIEDKTDLAAAARYFLERNVLPTGTTVEEYLDDPG